MGKDRKAGGVESPSRKRQAATVVVVAGLGLSGAGFASEAYDPYDQDTFGEAKIIKPYFTEYFGADLGAAYLVEALLTHEMNKTLRSNTGVPANTLENLDNYANRAVKGGAGAEAARKYLAKNRTSPKETADEIRSGIEAGFNPNADVYRNNAVGITKELTTEEYIKEMEERMTAGIAKLNCEQVNYSDLCPEYRVVIAMNQSGTQFPKLIGSNETLRTSDSFDPITGLVSEIYRGNKAFVPSDKAAKFWVNNAQHNTTPPTPYIIIGYKEA